MAIIYKATNTKNGKSYIGYTSKTLEERKQKHLENSRLNIDTKFYRAIRKYGEDIFLWEIIHENKDDITCLEVMEPYFIKTFNTIKEGYNTKQGGHIIPKPKGPPWNKGLTKHTSDIIAKRSQKIKGRSQTAESNKKRQESCIKYWENKVHHKKGDRRTWEQMNPDTHKERKSKLSNRVSGKNNPMSRENRIKRENQISQIPVGHESTTTASSL